MNFIVRFCIIGFVLGVTVGAVESCEDSNDSKQTDHDIAAKSVEGASKVMDVYDKKMDKVIPWDVFHETCTELEKGLGRYGPVSGMLVGEIKTAMLNSENNYFQATTSIYGWCGEAIPLLDGYLELFKGYDKNNAEAQKELLLEVLETGLKKMDIALGQVNQSIANFGIAAGKLNTLDNQLELDYKEGSKIMQEEIAKLRNQQWWAWLFPPMGLGLTIMNEVSSIPDLKRSIADLQAFFQGLRGHVTTAIDTITKARDELKRETIIIENLKCQTKVTRTFVGLKAAIKNIIERHANNLIKKCLDYRDRHKEKFNI